VGTAALGCPVERSSTTFKSEKGLEMRFALILLIPLFLGGCNTKSKSQPNVIMPSQVAAKRYHLTGKVVSVDKRAHMLIVDGQDIPGFMPAMTMPYQVKPESELDKLSPGDVITADVVVSGENAWLENISVTGHPAQQPK
jgi:protein SCO1/2